MANADCNSTEQGIDRIASASSILSELWERTADTLTTKELEWFADSGTHTLMQARNLSESIEKFGCEISDSGFGSLERPCDIATLLFTISHQMETIHGMMDIALSAHNRIARPDVYGIARKSEAPHA